METEVAQPKEAVKQASKPWDEERALVLAQKISELPLKLEGSILENNITKLYQEMEAKELVFKPACYLSDSWGCPDGIPIIGIPFYLADRKLARIEEEYTENLEKDEEIIVYLRHEAGHAFNYAYGLFKTEEWHSVFGPFSRPYVDDYKPNPLSKKFVKHMQGWYAQKHPDEDFAETFAVWMTPGFNWRKQYEGWDAIKKLEYIDRIAQVVGKEQPKIGELSLDVPVTELKLTILEFYERTHSKEYPKIVSSLGGFLDGDLREIFEATQEPSYKPAFDLIMTNRHRLRDIVYYWTGISINLVRSLIRYLAERAQTSGIYYNPEKELQYLMQIEAFLLTLAMNYRYTDRFIEI